MLVIVVILIITKCYTITDTCSYENISSPVIYSGATLLKVAVLSLLSLTYINRNHCWVSFSRWRVAYNESFVQGSTSHGMNLHILCCKRTVSLRTLF